VNPLDDTTLQVYSVLFVAITVVLVYTARYFQKRRRGRRQLDGFDQIPNWTRRSIASNRPLHLSFGGAEVGGENTPMALAEAEFFYQVIKRANASDAAPLVTMSAPATVPLGQDTVRRAWQKGDTISRVQWYPPELAFAGAITASTTLDEPAAHIMAGRFGPELALMLDSAHRGGQPSLALSDRLDGQAVAYAMADHVLIGEELFAASGYDPEDERGHRDDAVLDVWRALIIFGATVLLMLEFARQIAVLSWPLALAAILVALGVLISRRR